MSAANVATLEGLGIPLTEVCSTEFLRDALHWHRMLMSADAPCSVHGLELQQEMDEKYPREWMRLLYMIGRFEEERGNPYMEGYDAFYDGRPTHDNPYDPETESTDCAQWRNGWYGALEEWDETVIPR